MQKRLLWHLVASIAIIAAACGGATTIVARRRPRTPAAASAPRPRRLGRRRSARAGASASAGRADLADQPDPSRHPRRRGPGHARPEQGVDQHRHRRPPCPRTGASSTSTRTSTSSRRWRPSHADDLGRRPDLHVHPPRRQVQQRRPDRRRRPRVRVEARSSTRAPPRPIRPSCAPVVGADELIAHDRQQAGPDGRRHRRGPRQARRRRRRTTRPSSSSWPTRPRYFLDIVALWGAAPIQKKWVKTPNFTEAANYVSSGPFMMKTWTHQAEIVLVPNPNWYGQKPTLTEIDFTIGGDPTAEPGHPSRPASSTCWRPTRPTCRGSRPTPTLGPQVRDPAGPRTRLLGLQQPPRPARRPTSTSAARCRWPSTRTP